MTIIDQEFMNELAAKAAASPRRRAHFNLHKSLDEDIHRLIMAAQPDSYFRPHRHSTAGKSELLICLQGAVSMLVFNPAGEVLHRFELSPGGTVAAVELEENTFHALVANSPDTVLMEIKHGPYEPTPEADFGDWAPVESAPEAEFFMDWMRHAGVGDQAGR